MLFLPKLFLRRRIMKKIIALSLLFIVVSFLYIQIDFNVCGNLNGLVKEDGTLLTELLLAEIEDLNENNSGFIIYDYSNFKELSPKLYSVLNEALKHDSQYRLTFFKGKDSEVGKGKVNFAKIELFRNYILFRSDENLSWPTIFNSEQSVKYDGEGFRLVCD